MNGDNIIIREFEISDKEKVANFFDGLGGEARAFFNRGDVNKIRALAFFENPKEDKNNFVRWGAFLDGEMIGYVFVRDINRGILWLGIGVSDKCKGKGIGFSLMKTAENWGRQHGKGGIGLTTHLANLRGQCLYEKCGYERLGTHYSGEYLYLLKF